MNKTLKKALAAILAVLMVVCSAPFTALAGYVDSTTPDSGQKMHFFATRYDGKEQFLGTSDYYADNEAIQYFDTRNMTMDDVAETKDVFALVVTMEGIFKYGFITFDYDTDYITPAYYRTASAVVAYESTTNNSYKTACIKNMWTPEFDTTGTTSVHDPSGGLGSAYISVNAEVLDDGYADFMGDFEFAPDDAPGETLPGQIVAVFGFKLKQDCDLADVITVRPANKNTAYNPTESRLDDIILYGGENLEGPVKSYFTIPELGIGPADTPQPAEKVTYTFADGSTQEVDADAEAPANTADTEFAHVENTTTHAKTTYSWVADGDKAFKEVGTTVTDNCDMQTVANTAVEAGHLTDGKEADTKCSVCGNVVEGAVIKAEGHKYVETVVAPTCVDQGYTELKCSVCGDIQKKDFVEPTGEHTWVEIGVDGATCVTPGTVHLECSVCKTTKDEEGALGAHKLTAVAANEATCTEAGNVAYWSCEVCNKNFADAEGTAEIADVVIPAKGHTLSDVAEVPATCTEAGVGAGKVCSACDYTEGFETIPAKGHTWVDVAEVPATRAENGVAAGRYCSVCDAREGFETIPALGVDITISGSSLGTATVNGEEVANGVKNVPYAKAYTLVASANDGAEFIGWKVAGKLVSTSETYTTDAFADMTYVPVFVESNADAYTITFVDAYGNVVTSVSSAALPLAELPAAPEFAGLTFDAWSLDLDAVNALTESATVVANYNNDETKTFTVTAAGCTITVDGVESTDTATATYNSEVVVTAAGATAWTVNGSAEPAAYGETYTFYCGSDITVVPVMDAVTAVPAVKVVSFDKTSNHQVKFLATRSIPEGYQLVESGFVYGKGMTAADLVLENVGKTAGNADGVVKQAVCQNKAADGQFALTYGVKSMNATACAVAYAICRGAEGTVVYYSDAMIYNY